RLVTSLSQPGGNLTGVTFFGNMLGAKHVEMLHELIPGTSVIATLTDSTFPEAVAEFREVKEASRSIGHKIVPMTTARNAKSMLLSQASPTLVLARSSSWAVHSSRAKVKCWLSFRHDMPFQRSVISVSRSGA